MRPGGWTENRSKATGKLRLLKITYGEEPERKPIETEVRAWSLATNAEGKAEIQLKASEKGQFRLSYSVTDKAGHEIEGGYLFTIVGEGFDGSEFRFNDLEIVPDKREYAPDEKVQLQLNTNRIGSTVLLFVRPSNGVYLPPQVLKITGKSTVVDVGVTQKDMPNFFVEAVTISDGRVHTEVVRHPRAAGQANSQHGGSPLGRIVQAGAAGEDYGEIDRRRGQAVRRLDRALDLRQEPGIHFGRHERGRHQSVFLEVAARASPECGNEFGPHASAISLCRVRMGWRRSAYLADLS